MAKSNKLKSNKAKNKGEIFLDYASSASPNPSSIHEVGLKARTSLEASRKSVARELSALPDEIIFTSGGTESNNLAILGLVLEYKKNNKKVPHIITTNIEHPSVLETVRALEQRGDVELTIVSVEENGIVNPKEIKKVIQKNTILVSVMYANNEIGTIQPIKEISKTIRHYKKVNKIKSQYPFLHTDAVQAVNYLDLNIEKLGVDMLSLSGTKILNSGRVGVLYKKRNVKISPIMYGGDQEFGLRPGTENLNAVILFALALKEVRGKKEKEFTRLQKLQDYFLTQVKNSKILKKSVFILNGDESNRLPNNLNFTFGNIPSDLIVIELSTKGVMASPQSACKSGRGEGSYVIEAINKNLNKEVGGVRFSFGEDTTRGHVTKTVKALEEIVAKLVNWY